MERFALRVPGPAPIAEVALPLDREWRSAYAKSLADLIGIPYPRPAAPRKRAGRPTIKSQYVDALYVWVSEEVARGDAGMMLQTWVARPRPNVQRGGAQACTS